MRIGIIGLGGIGGFVGAKLAARFSGKGENSIVFIQRGEHGKHIKENGLTFKSKDSILVKPDELFDSVETAGVFDVIFFCIKSKDLEKTAQSFAKSIHEKTIMITLLNGVNNAIRLQKILPNNRILEGCIYVSSAITNFGEITQIGGSGKIFFGPIQGEIQTIDKEIENFLCEAQIKTELTASISTEVWKKYLFICPFATITSRYNLRIGEVVRNPDLLNQTKQLMDEIVCLSLQFSAKLTKEDVDSAIDLAFKIPELTPTSMQLDVYAGKLSEIDVFAEYVVNQGKELQVPVPVFTRILSELQTIIKKQIHG